MGTSRRQVIGLYVARYATTERAAIRAFAATPDAAKAEALLRSVINKRKPSERDLKQLLHTGVLPAPPVPWGAAPGTSKPSSTSRSTPRAPARLAMGPLPALMRADITAEILAMTKSGKYAPLLAALGHPSTDEWAALLSPAMLLAFKEDEKLLGQVATVSGWLLEPLRKSSPTFLTWSGDRVTEMIRAYNAHHKLTGSEAFGAASYIEHILDGHKQALGDGMRVARNGRGRLLISMIDEVKLESVAGDVAKQFDDDIRRIRERGIIINKTLVPPHLIDLPISTVPKPWGTNLVAYLENAKPRPLSTPNRYTIAVAPVMTHGLRDFVGEFLDRWRRRSLAKHGP